jgi:hypothetical protein
MEAGHCCSQNFQRPPDRFLMPWTSKISFRRARKIRKPPSLKDVHAHCTCILGFAADAHSLFQSGRRLASTMRSPHNGSSREMLAGLSDLYSSVTTRYIPQCSDTVIPDCEEGTGYDFILDCVSPGPPNRSVGCAVASAPVLTSRARSSLEALASLPADATECVLAPLSNTPRYFHG